MTPVLSCRRAPRKVLRIFVPPLALEETEMTSAFWKRGSNTLTANTVQRLLFVALACSFALVSVSCMLGPSNDQTLCGIDAPVNLNGYTLTPNELVELDSAPSETGPFTSFAGVHTSASPLNIRGTLLYPWSISRNVPGWTTAAAGRQVFVRARAGGVQLLTYDAVDENGRSPLGCINHELGAGQTILSAAVRCRSDKSPIVALSAPAVSTCVCGPKQMDGNVTVATADDAFLWRCLEDLNGDLSVTSAAPSTVNLSKLKTVRNLTVNYTQASGAPRQVDLSAIATVSGKVELDGVLSSGPLAVGMNALTASYRGLVVDLSNTSATPLVVTGLTNYSFVPASGELTLRSAGAFDSSGFIANLQTAEEVKIESVSLDTDQGLPILPRALRLAIGLQVLFPPGLKPKPGVNCSLSANGGRALSHGQRAILPGRNPLFDRSASLQEPHQRRRSLEHRRQPTSRYRRRRKHLVGSRAQA